MSNLPKLRCLFHIIKIMPTFTSVKLCLFPVFVASVWAITSGCMLQEFGFSHACTKQEDSAQCKIAVAGVSQFDEGTWPNLPFYHLAPSKYSSSATRVECWNSGILYVRTHLEGFQHTFSECWACMHVGACGQTWVCADTKDGPGYGECLYGACSDSLQEFLFPENIWCQTSFGQLHLQPRKAFPWSVNVAIWLYCWQCQLQ